MRRLAWLGLLLLLPGCTGSADFLGDTLNYGINPNSPIGDAENMQRARGQDAEVEPLTPEPGNVWPGPVQKMPTLQDLEKNAAQPTPTGEPYAPDHREPRPRPHGSSTPPGNVQPGLPPQYQPAPPTVSAPPPERSQSGRAVQTRRGPGVISGGTSGYQTLTTPQGSSVVVPNGNGTSTVIHPDGSVETVPTPK